MSNATCLTIGAECLLIHISVQRSKVDRLVIFILSFIAVANACDYHLRKEFNIYFIITNITLDPLFSTVFFTQ